MEFGKNDNDSKYIYFDSDDDFYKFCVVPEIKAKPFTLDNGETFYTMDFDLSNDYNMAIQNGNIFVILFPGVLSLMLGGKKKKPVSPFDLKLPIGITKL